MKKAIFMFILLIGYATVSFAQNFQEVVYLKNGSIIKGIVIEQIPNSSLKLQTYDGSIFVFKMSEVEKITKEVVDSKKRTKPKIQNTEYVTSNKKHNSVFNYKGFIDVGYTIGVGDWKDDRLELSTSHGCKINNYLYTGIGLGFSYFHDSDVFAMPIFANVRANLFDNNITPYVDFKIGYTILDAEGFYLSPFIGCKIDSFNVGIGYVLQKVETFWDESVNFGGVSLKIGYEF